MNGGGKRFFNTLRFAQQINGGAFLNDERYRRMNDGSI
jgi:hypothetical protein